METEHRVIYEQLPLFQFEAVLSLEGLRRAWMDAIEIASAPMHIPYGSLTADHIISEAVRRFGLAQPDESSPLWNDVQGEAETWAYREQSDFEYAVEATNRELV